MLTIRVGTPADDEVLAGIDRQTWTTAVSPAPTPAPATLFFGPGCDPSDVLVAEVDGDLAGYIALRAPALESHDHVVEIAGLAVAPSHQGQGIGAQLVVAALEEAGHRGAGKVSLHVLGTNTGARRLYERSGFEVEGVLRGEFRLDGAYVDDIVMARYLHPLGEPAQGRLDP